MAFATKYRIEFNTIKNRQVKIDIEEDGFGGSVTDLIASANPLEIDYPNGEFDKLASIRESKIRIRIKPEGVEAADFLTTSDTQYKVKIYVNNNIEWVGWLDNDYLSEPFLDNPDQIELSATDGLSLLKGIPLKDGVGAQIWGLFQVKTFIVTSLFQTGLDLDFWSFINMYPAAFSQRGTNADYDAFYYSWIMSHTFLEGPRDFNDCYTVLSKICEAFNCTLFQARGAWYFVHTNDRIAGDLDGSKRDYTGSAITTALNQNFAINIGLEETVKLVNADAVISWEKAYKDAVVKYRFNQPPIYFRNWDLIDGTFSALLSSSTRSVYTLTNWATLDATLASFYSLGSTVYTGVELDAATAAEQVRYLLFYEDTNPNNDNGATTTTYPITKNDKVNVSFSRREKNSGFVTSNALACFVRLQVGSDYYFLDDTGKWFLNTVKALQIGYSNAKDRRFWTDFTIQSEGCPANGIVSVTFTSLGHSRTSANEVHFKDINFSITTYFNEMTTVDGYEYKAEQTNELKNKYDNQIFISQSANISTQGSIMTNGYGQVADWKYYSALDATAVNFAKYIDRATWRTLYRNFTRFEGALYDLYGSSRLLSPLNTIQFTAIPNKEFMLTTLRMDLLNERAEFTAIELRATNNTDDFDELGTETFRYLNVKSESTDKVYEEKRPLNYFFGPLGLVFQLLKRNKRRRFNSYS